MDEDEASPSGNATEEEEDVDMSTTGKQVYTQLPSTNQCVCLHRALMGLYRQAS